MWSTPTASSASAPKYRTNDAERRSVIVDLLAGRGERVPGGTEVTQALPSRLAGTAVAGVAVERVASVRDLTRAIGAPSDAEQRRTGAVAGGRLAAREQRGPYLRACARAGTAATRVLLEQIDGAAGPVDDDATERRLRHLDGRRARHCGSRRVGTGTAGANGDGGSAHDDAG